MMTEVIIRLVDDKQQELASFIVKPDYYVFNGKESQKLVIELARTFGPYNAARYVDYMVKKGIKAEVIDEHINKIEIHLPLRSHISVSMYKEGKDYNPLRDL